MQIIKLNAIDSTNSFLKRLIRERKAGDNTVVVAGYQTGGKGQMGANWASEPWKNLMFSVFRKLSCIDNNTQFYISMAVALAMYDALKNTGIPEPAIKWPNDILSANKKICGILIENSVKKSRIAAAVIGVGVNVNQQDFPGLARASSLKNITGVTYDPGEILEAVLKEFDVYFQMLKEKKFAELKGRYEARLFGRQRPLTFKGRNGDRFTGLVKGVTEEGKLVVLPENETVKTFDLKSIEMLY